MDDRELVFACSRGDHAAFEALLGRYAGEIDAGCLRALRGRARPDLEEARAEVLSRLWASAPKAFGGFRFACPLEAWLRLLAYRWTLDWSRKEGLRRSGAPLPDLPAPETDTMQAEEELARLRAALPKLAPEDRGLLEDAYTEGLSHRELARRHAIPRGSVSERLRQAREKLRGLF